MRRTLLAVGVALALALGAPLGMATPPAWSQSPGLTDPVGLGPIFFSSDRNDVSFVESIPTAGTVRRGGGRWRRWPACPLR